MDKYKLISIIADDVKDKTMSEICNSYGNRVNRFISYSKKENGRLIKENAVTLKNMILDIDNILFPFKLDTK